MKYTIKERRGGKRPLRRAGREEALNREKQALNRERLNRHIRWQALAMTLVLIGVFAAVLFIWQERDLAMLQKSFGRLWDDVRLLQQERNDKAKESQMGDSADYLAGKAREAGYLMPGEIRFRITNLDELLENGAEAETEAEEETGEETEP